MKPIARYLQSLLRNEDGATALEFSILAIPLFMGIFILIEMGYKSMLQSELDDRLYAISNHITINAVAYDDAEEFMREYVCPELGTTFLRCEDVEFGALVIRDRIFRYRSADVVGNWELGCPSDPLMIEINYPAANVTSPINLVDITTRDGQKYFRSRTVVRREPLINGGSTCT